MQFSQFVFRISAVFCVGFLLSNTPQLSADTYTFHHENVLGTSLEIQIDADSPSTASNAEARVLDEIKRLDSVFSTYSPNTEFSTWQIRVGNSTILSPELFQVLQDCERWNKLSQGAFNPAIQELTQLWKQAEKQKKLPTASEVADAVAKVQQPQYKLDPATHIAVRLANTPLSLNAIAKGAIVDSACQATLSANDIHGVVVNIGGDLRACGQSLKPVRITNPTQDAVNAEPISTIHVSNRAIATSGNYHRGFRLGDQWYSHIIDPRTGQPTAHIASATVVAKTASDADALATILNVLPVEAGVALIESISDTSCLIIESNGQQTRSHGWSDLEQPGLFRFAAANQKEIALANASRKTNAEAKADEAKPVEKKEAAAEKAADAKSAPVTSLELVVKFELNRPEGKQYRRPYVAIWLEDADEFPVKTAVLWMQTKQPGPRWHRDLLRWFRNDGVRKLADQTDLIGTISSATRNAGEYKAVFDGKDDAGKPLPAGKYTLFIEVAREHGTYQLIRHKVNLGNEPIAETKLKANVEIKAASVEYRTPTAEPAASKSAAK